MKRVINGKVYNTETADELHTYAPYENTSDFHFFTETLYVTKKGAYFVAGEGGAMSAYAESLGGGSYGGGSGIRVLSKAEAMEWLEETGGDDVLVNDERFSADIEEA